ncbi:MAG: hypothetical protein E7192_01055 [Erysipelotrichaceae bacterium]|nr:hypothetical protein [Erysipelotrichaceae bacterium]
METKHLIIEEASRADLQMFCDVPYSSVYWKVMQKENDGLIGYVSFKEIEKSVIEINGFDVMMHENELMESLLNVVFYRLNARKVLFHCISNNIMKKNLMECFGFRKESLQEIDNENEETICIESYSLYKEEYIGWLRKRGKTLGFLRVKELRVVFLGVAAVGLLLFGMDLFRKINTLQTAFYAYLTGIGTAGAFACSWMSAKQKQEDKHHAG